MSSFKHVVNEPRQLVNEALQGLARLNPNIKVDENYRVVSLQDVPQDRVALISGGGSGHEPSHAGFVGKGLLTGAVCGNVFASPNKDQVRVCLEAVKNNKGTLIVIMRYTGDVLLFGLAKEQAAVMDPKHPVRMTIVGDDVAVGRKQGAIVGRRGLAGTVLVYKCASTVAEEGGDVEEAYKMSEFVAERIGTIGAGLDHCHIPGTGKGEAHLGEDQVEIGMGIHNEAGVEKIKLPSSKELIKKMLNMVTDTSDSDRGYVPFKHDGKDEVVLLVNNLGGMSELEMSSIANDAVQTLTDGKISVVRIMIGTVMTSLNLPGFSLSCLLLPRDDEAYSAERILQVLDAPASSPGWKFMYNGPPGVPQAAQKATAPAQIKSGGQPVAHFDYQLFEKAITAACTNAVKAEPEITRYDTIAGDGDCGETIKAMAEGVLAAFKSGSVSKDDVPTAVLDIARVIEKEGDGTSGALYTIFFNALAAGVADSAAKNNQQKANSQVWAGALDYALKALFQYTAARKPSRTLVDPLQAFVESFAASKGADLAAASQEAAKASEETKNLVALAGRSAYVNQDDLKKQAIPDPGAYALAKIIEGLQSVLA